MKIDVIQIAETPNSTASMMFIDGRMICFVIEDGFRAKKVPGETRASGGVYHLEPRRIGRFYEKYWRQYGHSFAIEVAGIPNFTAVLCHIGNTVLDTRGCFLLNMGVKIDASSGNFVGVDSTTAYRRFYDVVSPELKAGRFVVFNVVRSSSEKSPLV